MPIEVVNFPFQGNDDKCLVLSNAQWAATGIGTNWRTIRIGLRYCVEDIGASFPPPHPLFLGLMSNPTNDANGQLSNGYLSAVRGHMVGIFCNSTSYGSRSVNATRGVISYWQSSHGRRVVGGSVLDSSGPSTNYLYGSLGDFGTKRFGVIVEISKSVLASSYNAQITMYYYNAQATDTYGARGLMSLSGFINTILSGDPRNSLQAADGGGSIYYNTTPWSLAIDEAANGPLNAIHVAWGKISPRIAISDICYAILQ
jgi:hypothetical protein